MVIDSVQVPQWVCSREDCEESELRVPSESELTTVEEPMAMLPVMQAGKSTPFSGLERKRVKASDPETKINIYSTFSLTLALLPGSHTPMCHNRNV